MGPLPAPGTSPEFGVMITPRQAHTHIGELSPCWLRMLVQSHQLVVLRGFDSFDSPESLERYCATFGHIMMWPFGAVLDLQEQAAPDDHIFSNSYVPLHWDGMYLETVPEFQIFHCVNAGDHADNGCTTFASTPQALRIATPEVRELWSRAEGTYQRSVQLYSNRTRAPIINRHPQREFPVLRFCEQPVAGDDTFINPSQYSFSGIQDSEEAALIDSLVASLHDPRAYYAHQWQNGDVVLTDNFSLLHGRERFTRENGRHLRRVHIHSTPPQSNPHVPSQVDARS
ncbi:TauD/TfdA family dioxygenase [Pseudomonas synxantha]|nr:TauD/TfdA family dioxygenase [Pseudomonas synxantha]